MFFLLSKILSFLIDPFFWVIVIFLASLLHKRKYLRRRFLTFGLLFLILFSNPFIHKFINNLWTVKYETKNITYDYGILLGGMVDLESTADNIVFSKNNDRLLNTIELFSEKKIKKILITGASGSLTSKLKEAEILKNYLIKIGIPDSCVLAENSSKNWATAYKFKDVKAGLVRTEEINHNRSTGMQAFIFNTRREKFKDPRVRQALAFGFDFEWSNKNLFYGQYSRTRSYFDNSELGAFLRHFA